MQRYIPILIFIVVLIGTLTFLKRDREVDAAGDPTIRMWGPSVLFLLVVVFFLWRTFHDLTDPLLQKHPENALVDVLFILVGLIATLWNYVFTVSLKAGGVEYRVLFQRKSYPLTSVINISRPKRGSIAVQLLGGGKITLPSVASGVPYFIDSLSTQIESIKRTPSPSS
jgi:hypothetical protein